VIKWEREHHLRKEEEKPTSFAGDAAGMPTMPERSIVPPAVMAGQGVSAATDGKNE